MKKLSILFLVFLFVLLVATSFNLFAKKSKDLSGKKILMIIASKDFRDEEYSIPRKMLEAKGAKITVASTTLSEVKGMLKEITVKPDMDIKKAKAENYDAIIFIGGIGASEYWNNKVAFDLIKSANKLNKVIAAICIAPVTLAKSGVLKGKKATVWKSESEQLEKAGMIYVNKNVVVDGNIVTANGPSSTEDFALIIVEKLLKNEN